MNEATGAVTAHADERGQLVAVELPQLSFEVRRVFVVAGPPTGSERGDHLIPCEQLMVLISGSVVVTLGVDVDHLEAPVLLDVPGASVRLPAGNYVRYRLAEHAFVMVVAEQVYQSSEPL